MSSIFSRFFPFGDILITALALINIFSLLLLIKIKSSGFNDVICLSCINLPIMPSNISIPFAGLVLAIIFIFSLLINKNYLFLYSLIVFTLFSVFVSSYLTFYQVLLGETICKICLISSGLFLLIFAIIIFKTCKKYVLYYM